MRIALFLSPKDSIPKPVDVSWETLRDKLLRHKRTPCNPCRGKDCPEKFGEAWSPADYPDSSLRADTNVRAITAAVFDLEGPEHAPLSDEEMLAVAHAVEGLRYVCHSTHTRGAYRLVVELSRPVQAVHWPAFYVAAIELLKLPADRTCRNPSRLFFFPTCSAHGPEPVAVAAEGKPLDVDAVLAGVRGVGGSEPSPSSSRSTTVAGGGSPLPPPPAPLSAPPQVSQGPIDLEPVRQSLRRQKRPASAALARKILDGLPLGVPGGTATEPGRDQAVNAAASLVATAAPVMLPEEAALELLRPSITAMHCEPEGLQHWMDKARYSYQRACARRAANDAARDAERRAVLAAAGITEDAPGNFNAPVADERATAAGEAVAATDWKKGLLIARDLKGQPCGIKGCSANVALILEHDDEWRGNLRFNEVTKEIDVLGGPMKHMPKATLETETLIWLERSAYKVTLKPAQVGSVLLAVARRNSYDPLANYLNALEWDGIPRIDSWLAEYAGAADTEHTRRVGRRWFVSAVARALVPGCKVDTVLILEGSQGKNKSQTLDALFSPFFSDTRINVHDKDSRMLASQVWGVELGELTTFSKADAESLKQFFSQREDKFRPPYGRVLEPFKRRCVFIGTTNKDEYLSDPTGNRRYWPVRVEEFDIEGIKQDKDQLWAEAVAVFRAAANCPECPQSYGNRCAAHRWWLAPEEAQVAELEAQERAHDVVYKHSILAWWLRKELDRRPEYVTVQDVADEALNIPTAQQTHKARMDIGIALRELGFDKYRKRHAGALVWAYRPSETLRTASQVRDGRGESLAVVLSK